MIKNKYIALGDIGVVKCINRNKKYYEYTRIINVLSLIQHLVNGLDDKKKSKKPFTEIRSPETLLFRQQSYFNSYSKIYTYIYVKYISRNYEGFRFCSQQNYNIM